MKFICLFLLLQLSLLLAQNRTVTPIEQDAPAISSGKYYALLIAVEDYAYIKDLDYPVSDASALQQVLIEDYNFSPENVRLLKNPDRDAILGEFASLKRKLTANDNLLIFYAGHGYWDKDIQQGYWQPSNAKSGNISGWISNSDIRDQIRGINSKHTLLISDACFSGGIFKTRATKAPSKAVRQLYRIPSRRGISSGTLNEVPDRSVFAQYLIKRLQENREDYISAEKLFSQFKEAVINNSPNNQVPQYGVIHQAGDEGGDFIFMRLGAGPLPDDPNAGAIEQSASLNTTAPSRRIAEFRSTPIKNLKEAAEILKRWEFYEINANPTGKGFANDYELQTRQGRKVVVDHASGLMWQLTGSAEYKVEYFDALEYIKELNWLLFGGFSDWRLPTLEEAMSLMESEKNNDDYHIDSIFVKPAFIWTSDQPWGNNAWSVDFKGGFCAREYIDTKNFIIAVRSIQ